MVADDGCGAGRRVRRPGPFVAGAGALLLLVGIVGIRLSMASLGRIDADVRPATMEEAPDPAHVTGTYVGDPDAPGSGLLVLKRTVVWLAVLAVLAAVGVGMIVWGVQVALRTRPQGGRGAPEVAADAEEQ